MHIFWVLFFHLQLDLIALQCNYFSKYSPPRVTHLSHHGTSFCIPVGEVRVLCRQPSCHNCFHIANTLLLRTGIQVSPMCPLCDDAEEINLGHIHKRHSLTGNMDNANNRINGGIYQNYIGLQEGKWETFL